VWGEAVWGSEAKDSSAPPESKKAAQAGVRLSFHLAAFRNFTAFGHRSIMHKAIGLKDGAVQMQQSRPEQKLGPALQ